MSKVTQQSQLQSLGLILGAPITVTGGIFISALQGALCRSEGLWLLQQKRRGGASGNPGVPCSPPPRLRWLLSVHRVLRAPLSSWSFLSGQGGGGTSLPHGPGVGMQSGQVWVCPWLPGAAAAVRQVGLRSQLCLQRTSDHRQVTPRSKGWGPIRRSVAPLCGSAGERPGTLPVRVTKTL